MFPEVRLGHGFGGLKGRAHVRDVRLVRLLDERASRAEGVDGDEMVRSMAADAISCVLFAEAGERTCGSLDR